jgi:hypothetical protein
MSTPQQPELRRSGRGQTDPASAKADATTEAPSDEGPTGSIPEANRPGHHPEHEQDRPDLDEAAAAWGVRPPAAED